MQKITYIGVSFCLGLLVRDGYYAYSGSEMGAFGGEMLMGAGLILLAVVCGIWMAQDLWKAAFGRRRLRLLSKKNRLTMRIAKREMQET